MSVWRKLVSLTTGAPAGQAPLRRFTRRELIRMESQIGSQVFGPIPADHQREFFYFENNTWIWYEGWTDKTGQHSVTTSYEIHPHGVLKVQQGQPYATVEGQELQNLLLAIKLYYERTTKQVYRLDPTTRQPI